MKARLGNRKHCTPVVSAASTRIPVASRRSRSFAAQASRCPRACGGGVRLTRCRIASVSRAAAVMARGSYRSSWSWRGASTWWPAWRRSGMDARPRTPEPPVIRIRISTSRQVDDLVPAQRRIVLLDTASGPVRDDQPTIGQYQCRGEDRRRSWPHPRACRPARTKTPVANEGTGRLLADETPPDEGCQQSSDPRTIQRIGVKDGSSHLLQRMFPLPFCLGDLNTRTTSFHGGIQWL